MEDVEKPREQETLPTDSPKATSGEDITDNSDLPPRPEDPDPMRVDSVEPNSDQPPRPEDPVPMSVDSVDPAPIPTPSDESWAELDDRTCGDTAPAMGGRGREKRQG